MKRINQILIIFFLIGSIAMAGCASTKKGCGCPNKKGMVGY
jgi:outer membrane murein-binding lipoprotein Lpp